MLRLGRRVATVSRLASPPCCHHRGDDYLKTVRVLGTLLTLSQLIITEMR